MYEGWDNIEDMNRLGVDLGVRNRAYDEDALLETTSLSFLEM